jgi:DNA-cytosine methyltransferase
MNLTQVNIAAGIGGFDLGFSFAGFKNLASIDNSPYARDTYNYNFEEKLIFKDIWDWNPPSSLHSVDTVNAGIPCQSWSTAGKRRGFEDERGLLFFRFKELITEIEPKIFVLENVMGVTAGESHKYIKNEMTSCGYNVRVLKLNSAEYGVAQVRKRLVWIGTRNDLKMSPLACYPEITHDKTNYLTIADVLLPLPVPEDEKLYSIEELEMKRKKNKCFTNSYKPVSINEPFPTVTRNFRCPSSAQCLLPIELDLMKYDARNHNALKSKIETLLKPRKFKQGFMILDFNKPSPTFTENHGNTNILKFKHKGREVFRRMTVLEALMIQSFLYLKPDFSFPENVKLNRQLVLIGNAFPPWVAFLIASNIKKELNRKITRGILD